MSHEVESLAWVGQKPWHGLGTQVSNDLTAKEMMIAAGCDWEVAKADLVANLNGNQYSVGKNKALLRTTDGQFMDVVGDDWNPVQNKTAFEFFKDFVDAGQMKMETAGSLSDGKMVWALAEVEKSFELFNGDKVKSYLLFSNPHKYGKVVDVRLCMTRVVCNNTIRVALGEAGNAFKSNHATIFDADKAKKFLGLVDVAMDDLKAKSEVLASKQYTDEKVNEFFDRVFPVQVVKGGIKKKDRSKNAEAATLALTHQPGVEFAPGSWYQALQAVTYTTNHLMGRNQETRVSNLWYGTTGDKNNAALDLALEYAEA